MKFSSAGVLFASNFGNDSGGAFLVTINTSTGQVTTVGLSNPGLDAIAFSNVAQPPPTPPATPLPPTVLLTITGLAAAGIYQVLRKEPFGKIQTGIRERSSGD